MKGDQTEENWTQIGKGLNYCHNSHQTPHVKKIGNKFLWYFIKTKRTQSLTHSWNREFPSALHLAGHRLVSMQWRNRLVSVSIGNKRQQDITHMIVMYFYFSIAWANKVGFWLRRLEGSCWVVLEAPKIAL